MKNNDTSSSIPNIDFEDQVNLIKSTKQVHSKWYRENYADVETLNIDPAVHYLRYGAMMGRDPGKNFHTNFYVSTYPDVTTSGLNPLVHYALYGQALGYARRGPKKSIEIQKIPALRTKLLSLGFTEAPLEELHEIVKNSFDNEACVIASRDLALWQMRQKNNSGYELALEYFKTARSKSPNIELRRKIAVGELLCHIFLGDHSGGMQCFEHALMAGELSTDLLLAKANMQEIPQDRLELINRAMSLNNISPITLESDDGRPAYERLSSAVPIVRVENGPKVTVLIAAYEAATTLPTALRSIQEQSWQNLEIIVLDDCSPDSRSCQITEKYMASDNRIRLIKMEKNGGAYVARNRGLSEATGKYVTLHDADDWSHPLKIETQVRFLEENPEIMGCTSQQARATENLEFLKWAGPHGSVALCKENVSSFMQRHKPVFEKIGYWDPVRFGADSERMRRAKLAFGEHQVVALETGPLSLQRISASSIVSDDAFGVDGFFFGARLFYLEAQITQHTKSIKYENPNKINFPVPQVMNPDREHLSKHFDIIIVSDYRMQDSSTKSSIEEMISQKRSGLRTGVVQMNRYDYPANRRILPDVFEIFDVESCVPIAYGEDVTCNLLIVRYPPVLEHLQRYIPNIKADDIRVIINQPPMSDYGPNGERHYYFENCVKNIRHSFGKDAIWHPDGPLIRKTIHEHHENELVHIHLSDSDWSDIIDVKGWERTLIDYNFGKKIRIGRHSSDNEHRWPNNKKDILAAYPDSKEIDVHILGDSESALALIESTPPNWKIYEVGSIHPKEFLRELDFWIYFSHPDWLENSGRSIIEAMAVGVPVIISEDYRPIFKNAAIYATPETAIAVAKKLYADADAYNSQVLYAKSYVETHFSYEMHIERVSELCSISVNVPAVDNQIDTNFIKNSENSLIENSGKSAKGITSAINFLQPELSVDRNVVIPRHLGKTSGSSLSGISVVNLLDIDHPDLEKTTLMKCTYMGHQFDYLWKPKAGADRLFVIFSGDVTSGDHEPPVFQRWKWAEHFPGHCLYVSDPMLHMASNLGLAWYAGTTKLDPIDVIIRRIKKILPFLGLSDADVTAYGSSGGGFAAIRMIAKMPGASAVAINPQTNIAKFNRSSPDRYARTCLMRADRHSALADFPDRMDLIRSVPTLKHRNLIFIQNRFDIHHYEEHYVPFCQAMGTPADENLNIGSFRRILFDQIGGHRKAETSEVFFKALNIIESNFLDLTLQKIN